MIQPEYLISPTSQTTTYYSCNFLFIIRKISITQIMSTAAHYLVTSFMTSSGLNQCCIGTIFMIPFGYIHWEFHILGIPVRYGYLCIFLF